MSIPYEGGILWNVSHRCNLRCAYCISGPGAMDGPAPAIDIARASKTLSGRTFVIGFVGGGEPFFVPNLVEASIAFSRHHYLAFFTNLVIDRVKGLAEIDPARVLMIVASLHIKELERLGLVGKYIENFLLLKSKRFPMTAEVVAHPNMLPDIQRYRTRFLQLGIDITFCEYVGDYRGKSYPKDYTEHEIEQFGLSGPVHARPGFCNAGYNICVVDKGGIVTPCYDIKASLGHIYDGFSFEKGLRRCSKDCSCPLWDLEPRLFSKALEMSNI